MKHKLFGKGRIVSISGSGTGQIFEIQFENGMTKKLAAAFAPLEKA